MAQDNWRTVSFSLRQKSFERLQKVADDYGYKPGRMIAMLLEAALMDLGEPIETSSTAPNGERDKNGIPVRVQNMKRKIL